MIRLVSYQYPNKIKVAIGRTIYEYKASEYWCEKMMRCIAKGGEWKIFNEFRKQAQMVGKEVRRDE